jgi:hypothetical protein
MSDKKNIDRFFQEKFKDFEVAPNDAVWDRINESLPNKKKNRRVITLWWQLAGVAAVVAILLTIGVSTFNSNDNNNQEFPIVNADKTDNDSTQDEDGIKTLPNAKQDALKNEDDKFEHVDSENHNENKIEEQENFTPEKDNRSNPLTSPNSTELNAIANKTNEREKATVSQKRNTLTTVKNKNNSTEFAANTKTTKKDSKNSDDAQLATENEIKSAIKKTIEENKTTVAENSSSNISESNSTEIERKKADESKTENTIIEDSVKQSITDAIADNTNTVDEKEEDKQNRWSIAPNVAPVYFSSLGQGSPINSQFDGNSKGGNINMSYGIAGSYAVSNKIKIRTGINRVNLNHLTSDVITFTGGEVLMRGENPHMSNVKYKAGLESVTFMNAGKYNLISKPDNYDTLVAGDIDQQFGFIEVPIEVEYKLLNKKFGVNVIGGFSTFFLNNNEIYADIDGVSTLIGEASNINDTSFSANFGLGMDYKLSKQWNINLEPTFKYQINTFNNTSGDFKPFFVGVYTGLSFKF